MLICKCYPIYLATTNVFRIASVLNPFTAFISIFRSAEGVGNMWLSVITSQTETEVSILKDMGNVFGKIARNS